MSNDTTADFLLGGGGKSATFETIGDAITGTVVSSEVKQQTDISTGTPQTWDNGDPKMQLVVRLQTTLREDEDDDGIRAIYVKGSKKAGSQSLHDAVATAVRTLGAKTLEVGGTLTVTHTGTEPSKTRGFNARKLYSATYTAPDHAAATGDFLGTAPVEQAPVQQVPAPTAPPIVNPAQDASYQQWLASQGRTA